MWRFSTFLKIGFTVNVMLVSVVISQTSDDDSGEFIQPNAVIEAPIFLNETEFKLFTKKTPEGNRVFLDDAVSLRAAQWDVSRQTIIVTHGFGSNTLSNGQEELRKDTLDVNYITVDWNKCSDLPLLLYPVSINCALKVGGFIAKFIKFLVTAGANLKAIHLIGHSLGSHAMSQPSNYGIKVSRITGFDPTQVLFWTRPESQHLDPSDAEFVDVIHTNIFFQGWNRVLGHTDFFPNGGDFQPECAPIDIECNHEMSYHLYSQSLYENMKYPALRCETIIDANRGTCNGPTTYMGVISLLGPRGIFYINTRNISARNSQIL